MQVGKKGCGTYQIWNAKMKMMSLLVSTMVFLLLFRDAEARSPPPRSQMVTCMYVCVWEMGSLTKRKEKRKKRKVERDMSKYWE